MKMKEIHQQDKESGSWVGVVQKGEEVQQRKEGQGYSCHQGHFVSFLKNNIGNANLKNMRYWLYKMYIHLIYQLKVKYNSMSDVFTRY